MIIMDTVMTSIIIVTISSSRVDERYLLEQSAAE